MSIASELIGYLETAIQWLESHHANALASYNWDTVLYTDEVNSLARQLGYPPVFLVNETSDHRQLAVCSPTGTAAAVFIHWRLTSGEAHRNVMIGDGQDEAAAVAAMKQWISFLSQDEVTQ